MSAPPPETVTTPLSDPATWLERHGDCLFRYALARVRDALVAEEMVQETLLAALQARRRFAGQSSERTWLVGILKHKIIDQFRRNSREQPTETIDRWTEYLARPFDADGEWRAAEGEAPAVWSADARAALDGREFRQVLAGCLEALPTRIAEAFALRELDEMETAEICKTLAVSPTNLWVMLHRARAQLRRCLERRWFAPTASAPRRESS